jgi:acyl-CoA dehydrogenase
LANAREWDDEGLIPESVFQEFARMNMLIPSLPAPLPVEWLKKLGIHDLLGVVKVEDYDYIHLMIYTDEVY